MKRNKLPTPAAIIVAMALAVGVIEGGANATISSIDQANSVGTSITHDGLTPGQTIGQSFTPNFSGIDEFDIQAASQGIAMVQLDLLSGYTTVGIPIASTPINVIGNATIGTVEFRFPTTVSLVPGQNYTARLVLISGNSYTVAFSDEDPYSGGDAFGVLQIPAPGFDIVFSEGLISVPEPSSILLLAVLLFGLILGRKALRPRRTSLNRSSFGLESANRYCMLARKF